MRHLSRALAALILAFAALPVAATFHLWRMQELYSNADGTVQYLELSTNSGGQQFLDGHNLSSTSGATSHDFDFVSNLPGDSANKTFLVATQGFAALGIVTPDYIVPNGFFFFGGGSINFAAVDTWNHGALPGGNLSLSRNGTTGAASPRNFAGQTGSLGPALPTPGVALSGPSSSTDGDPVTFTVVLSGGNNPTGSVQFKNNGANLGGLQAISGGSASVSTDSLSVGTHTITAAYLGDGNNSPATSNSISHRVDALTAPPPPGNGSGSKTLGSRGTVTPTATLFGGFEISEASTVYILVRGNSLGTLGVTQGFLDAPLVRLFDGQGHDLIGTTASPGFTGCSSTANSGAAVVNYYTNVRHQAAHERDGCTAQTLPAGVYTFTVTPSTLSAPTSGEILFEVTLGSGSGTITKTLGSRGTVGPSATLFGGFELTQSSNIYILVRGNSLGSLNVTQAFLDSPRVRVFDANGQDLINESTSVAGFTGCGIANAGAPVIAFYTLRGQAPHTRDGCTSRNFPAGVYTFTVTPSTTNPVSAPSSGEVLFEVTLGH
jgi:hypothetical protein